MRAHGVDERNTVRERIGANFVVFIYTGGAPGAAWAVGSRLITDADLPGVLRWLAANLPTNCCWSLGVVTHPADPTETSDVDVSWIVGADVLNTHPADWSPVEQRIVEQMLARRHRVDLP